MKQKNEDFDEKKAVTMPVEYRKPPEPPPVSEMAVGETAYISWASISVSPEGRTFVHLNAKQTTPEADPSDKLVKVRREAGG
jgi:hypothetical protein